MTSQVVRLRGSCVSNGFARLAGHIREEGAVLRHDLANSASSGLGPGGRAGNHALRAAQTLELTSLPVRESSSSVRDRNV